MDVLLQQLRASADPTRLRLLAICARGAFCVTELTDILRQSQPRLSRHLKLLVEAGLLECSREGAHAWFGRAATTLIDELRARLPEHDPLIAADARAAARVLAERARVASASFRRQGADWDEMRALDLPAARVEHALLAMLQADQRTLGDVLDIGTGTGRLLELLSPHAATCLGIDASPAMLALARNRLSAPAQSGRTLANCRVRKADAYRLDLPSARYDVVLAQMLLHHAEDPGAILAEAGRVLRPGGVLVVIDLDAQPALADRGFRWPGFANSQMRALLAQAGLTPRAGAAIAGPLAMRLWPASAPAGPAGHQRAPLRPPAPNSTTPNSNTPNSNTPARPAPRPRPAGLHAMEPLS